MRVGLIKIISGGQTGVDQGALQAALDHEFPCGGYCPKGRICENGTIPEHFPLTELDSISYEQRTRKNVEVSDATLILHDGKVAGGTRLTQVYAEALNKPCFALNLSKFDLIEAVPVAKRFIQSREIKILNIAGPRASEWSQAYPSSYDLVSVLVAPMKNGDASPS